MEYSRTQSIFSIEKRREYAAATLNQIKRHIASLENLRENALSQNYPIWIIESYDRGIIEQKDNLSRQIAYFTANNSIGAL